MIHILIFRARETAKGRDAQRADTMVHLICREGVFTATRRPTLIRGCGHRCEEARTNPPEGQP